MQKNNKKIHFFFGIKVTFYIFVTYLEETHFKLN